MPLAVQELHRQDLKFPVLLGGAAINRKFGYRALLRERKEDETIYEPGVFYCKDAFEGLAVMDKLVEPEAREELVAKTAAGADRAAQGGRGRRRPDRRSPTTACVLQCRPTCRCPTPPFWGVREIDVPIDEVYNHLDTHVLYKLHWGGRGMSPRSIDKLLRDDFQPRLERMWAGAGRYLHPRAKLGYFPCYSEGNEIVVLDPDDRTSRARGGVIRSSRPRQPRHDRICLADFYKPREVVEARPAS